MLPHPHNTSAKWLAGSNRSKFLYTAVNRLVRRCDPTMRDLESGKNKMLSEQATIALQPADEKAGRHQVCWEW